MSSEPGIAQDVPRMELELYFLIARFLSSGPCQEASKVLLAELARYQLLPKRIDWEGREHFRTYDSLVSLYRHIHSDHLLQICQRIGPLLEREVRASVGGADTLLGAGCQSVLRTEEDIKYIRWKPEAHVALRNHRPLCPPQNLAHPPNVATIVLSRALSGNQRQEHALPNRLYSKMTRLSRSLGHLSAVYCFCFDRTGEYFFTGADDSLVKVWSALTGRLLVTLRGHSAEITDMDVSFENTLLAAGSCDKIIRVWCLRSMAPVAVLHGHTSMITSLSFSPYMRGGSRYLATTGGDGCVCFWRYNVDSNEFDPKPIKFIEKSRAGAQMLCSSFSPGGVFLTTGSSDHVVRVYSLAGPNIEKICELESHIDRVDSMSYSHHSTRFVSGSKDGCARIWRFERQQWRCIILDTAQKLSSPDSPLIDLDDLNLDKLRVTMVNWSSDDSRVITAISDCTLKVWDSYTGELLKVLESHLDEVFVLETNPVDPRILLSAGHDGYIFLWDIVAGAVLKKYFNNIQGQGHGAVFDCKWAPDGQSFATTDSHGFIMYFGFGSNEIYQRLPEEMFFHTDYRPLIRDANDYVLDEQTQQPPHLMPPPFLVDIDGNPHPPRYQRLVPGREKCDPNQLIPHLAELPNGDREVLDEIDEQPVAGPPEEAPPAPEPAGERDENGDIRIIDRMIEHLQHEQDERLAASGHEPLLSPRGAMSPTSPPPVGADLRRPSDAESVNRRPSAQEPLSPPPIRGPRRSGEQEGVRLAQGHVPVSQRATPRDIANWRHRVIVKELDSSVMKANSRSRLQLAEDETKKFVLERKRKPLPLSGTDSSDTGSYMKTRRHKRHRHKGHGILNEEMGINRLTTRALYDTEEDEETPGGTTEELEEMEEELAAPDVESDHLWKSSSDGESSDYSDWIADAGLHLQPPQRRSARLPKRRRFSSVSDSDEDDDDRHRSEDSDELPSRSKKASSKSKKQAQASKAAPPKHQSKRARKLAQKRERLLTQQANITELPEAFKPPEWLTEVEPRRSPYFPQIGDEVMYFRQGHEVYLNAVKARKCYDIDISRNQPWHKLSQLREMELVKVVGLKYEVRPPRLVCLKLSIINSATGRATGASFSVKYHDMPDVVDFIVLKQTFDIAMRRKWKVGDRFRSLIDDSWWFGVIETQVHYQELYPDSPYYCFTVHWDNGEIERMSPWDLEPVNENRMPRNLGGSVSVTDHELSVMTYQPQESDWPEAGRDEECSRISEALDKVMELSIAEHFLAPVDLNAFPLYAMIIAYPVDLSLIKERLQNHFYRRVNSIQFDIRHIESNALLFNQPKSRIVQLAKQVTELCLRVISDTDCYDPMPIYNKITKDKAFKLTPLNQEETMGGDQSEEEPGPSTSRSRRRASYAKKQRYAGTGDADSWRQQCQQLLEIIFDCEDSEPFRHAVDPVLYPTYYEIVDTPMDLDTVREQLQCHNYDNPMELAKDVRIVFHNSKLFNTNKRSRIYAMTLRMAAMFEARIKEINQDWKAAVKGGHVSRRPHSLRRGANKSRSRHQTTPSPGMFSSPHSGGASGSSSRTRGSGITSSGASSGPSRSRIKELTRKAKLYVNIDDDEDEEDEEEEEESAKSKSRHHDSDDSDYKANKRKRSGKTTVKKSTTAKTSKGKSKLVNGHSKRYTTRCTTGSLQRKNYKRVFEEASDHDNRDHDNRNGHKQSDKNSDTSGTEDEEEEQEEIKETPRVTRSSPSKPPKTRPPPQPKGASKRRRIESDSDNSDRPRSKIQRKPVLDSDEDSGPGESRKSRTRGLSKTEESDDSDKENDSNDDDNGEDNEDDNDNNKEKDSDSDESDKHGSNDSSDEATEVESDHESNETDSEVELPRKTRAMRQTMRQAKPHSTGTSSKKRHGDSQSSGRYGTRSRGKRTVQYHEDSEAEHSGDEATSSSISRSGRVRKITPRARAIFS